MIAHLPFTIAVEDQAIDDLKIRLRSSRFSQQIAHEPWTLGTDRETLINLCHYWESTFDWRSAEMRLNEWPQFVCEIEGEKLHYAHIRSPHDNATPLVMTHGWPGSIAEFVDVVGPLTNPLAHGGHENNAFHVVLPSLPGFGFSGPTQKMGTSPTQIATMIKHLMADLGYGSYLAQGGDWGSIITTELGRLDADHLIGIHITMPIAGPTQQARDNPQPEDLLAFQKLEFRKTVDGGYAEIQGTMPQTIGYALDDSPAGLAAWILEKFRTWSDCEGDLLRSYTWDQLLTNISIYWFTQTASSSARIYYEMRQSQINFDLVEIPVAIARFPGEIFLPPRAWCEQVYNIKRWTEFGHGGHFAAMEVPQLLVGDLRAWLIQLHHD
ncbi:MAG TPA: epoxide hydrolase [Acidimicrobiia bacterium]|nr:epoxide hydrolase [Acidimicrobiia bacterium]HIL06674.1 epoxide hydrolase [Acidimicrobiia bacterium]